MAMEWNSLYETGEQRVDSQHQKLFEQVNQLGELIKAGQENHPIDKAELDQLLGFLDTYVNVHFAYEELCMTLRRCPVASQNKDAHNRFIEFYEDFRAQYNKRGANLQLLRHLHQTLTHWLTSHICEIDIKLRTSQPPSPP